VNITIIFFLGLIIALVGVVPPGLLNMTAAKISLKEGDVRGVMFSIGVCVTVLLQTYIAAIFARYLSHHTEVIEILQRVAFVIFVLITVYFLLIAKKEPKRMLEPQTRSKKSRFFQGVFLSGINVFPIPYQAYMTITLASFGWLDFSQISIIAYVAGAAMGTFVMLYIYMFFFHKIKDKPIASQKSMNYLIGGITGVISIVTLINIIKNM
jgi:threonine/homoserine/homoserine lactone efflux protein